MKSEGKIMKSKEIEVFKKSLKRFLKGCYGFVFPHSKVLNYEPVNTLGIEGILEENSSLDFT